MPDRPTCFVIAPIGNEGSETRRRSDMILKHIITPVAAECGFDAIRADKISEAGMITTQVINHIVNDPMVVADLTGSNANVFYELAVRHATRKPFVQIIQKGETIPFDVAGLRTIELDHTNLDSVEAAKEAMKRQLAGQPGHDFKVESPISVAIDFDRLHKSDDPEKRQIADILQGITELKGLIERREDESIQRASRAVVGSVMTSLRAEAATTKKEIDREAAAAYEMLLELQKMERENAGSPSPALRELIHKAAVQYDRCLALQAEADARLAKLGIATGAS